MSAPEVVISGLNNPRGLTFAGTTLYVAESGAGGNGACIKSSEGATVCYGATGAITAVPDASTVTGRVAGPGDRLVSGLPSLATQTDDPSTPQPDQGTQALGPADVSVAPDGTIYFPIGLGAPPASRDALTQGGAPGDKFAELWKVQPDGSGLASVADLAAFEAAHNPDQGIVPTSSLDTNPYSVLVSGSSVLVADAGGDDVLSADPATGALTVAAVLPPIFTPAPPFLHQPPGTKIPAQPVPDSLAAGPGGTTYVGQLTGFPFPVGGASVFTLGAGSVTPYATGFTNVIDETVGPDGDLYVLEIAHNSLLGAPPTGGLYRVSDNGARKQLLLDNLNFPGGIAFGPDGMAYITTCSVCTAQGPSPAMTGNVVRYDAVHAPALLTRLSGPNRIDTAVAVSKATFPNGAPAVVVARSDEYADAIAGSVLAEVAALPGTSPGGSTAVPLLLTRSDSLSPQTAAEINRLGATKAYILGGTGAISDSTMAAITAQTHVTDAERVGGANRFATAADIKAKVEQLIGKPVDGVYLADGQQTPTGGGFADAMSVAPLAAHQVRPVLLVKRDQLPAETATALSGVPTATIVGGTGAVSDAVAAAVKQLVGDLTPRLSGADRYATSAAVVGAEEAAGLDVAKTWLATGLNWPDAIAAGPAVAADGGVLLLVNPNDLGASQASQSLLTARKPASVTFLGGYGAISLNVEQQVLKILAS